MQNRRAYHYLLHFLRHNWFKLCVGILLLLLAFKKEFSLNINFQPPTQQTPQQEMPRNYSEKKVRRETLTENITTNKELTSAVPSNTQKFNFSEILQLSDQPADQAIQKLAQTDAKVIEQYLKRFAHVAEKEKKKFGIPASIILANALLLSNAGQNGLAQSAYNQFRLPCTVDWKGETEKEGARCYRKYPNAWTSFRDYSLFLTTGKNSVLRQFANQPYQKWATALEEVEITKEEDLAQQLILIIEHFKLYHLDS